MSYLTEQRGKPRDVQVLPIGPHTFVLRSRSWTRLRFEVEYGLQRGTTANSYVIQGDQIALIDPPGESFTEIFLEALGSRFPLATISYLILGHVNPNRATTLGQLLTAMPAVTIVCSNPAAAALRTLLPDLSVPIMVIRGEETLDLGRDHHLEFIPTPMPRWPDHLCTYDPATQLLFTDKLFAAHVCGDQVFDEGWLTYLEDRRYYYDSLLASQPRQVETALDKLISFPVVSYAPGHGPIVRDGRQELTNLYRTWSQQQKTHNLSVALVYASAYGNTTIIGEALAQGIQRAGVAVELLNCEVNTPAEIKAAVEQCDGVLIGSPTLGGHLPTQVQTAIGIILSTASRNVPVGVFGSFGWSGEAVDMLESKLKEAGFSFGFEPIRVKFKPTEATIQLCENTGIEFAQTLRRTLKLRQVQSLRAPNLEPSGRVEQAVGRVISALAVVTAQRDDFATGSLIAALAQATFNPPGLTLAVAKTDPIEPLLHLGDPFVLNILAEGKTLRRHFQKPHTPGTDRFAGLATETATNGGIILSEALSYLEMTVQSRMDCGDQWVIYAVSDSGKVLQPNGRTAVIQRQSGL